MQLNLFQVDAFTDTIFGGNPACVVPLQTWLPVDTMLAIARENAVAETAFFILRDEIIDLRWFTPEIEMDLCGHATLAAAHVLKAHLHYPQKTMQFSTQSGILTVWESEGSYTLDLPSRPPVAAELPSIIRQSLNKQPKEVYQARDFMLVYETEQDVLDITIDRQAFDQINLDPGGVIVTAPGNHCDFVSRFFTPQASILEDPVTGSAHCTLTSFWSKRLGKKTLTAQQVSARLGKLLCTDNESRVHLQGNARTYSIGTLWYA